MATLARSPPQLGPRGVGARLELGCGGRPRRGGPSSGVCGRRTPAQHQRHPSGSSADDFFDPGGLLAPLVVSGGIDGGAAPRASSSSLTAPNPTAAIAGAGPGGDTEPLARFAQTLDTAQSRRVRSGSDYAVVVTAT
jgi:hypothetical protein